MLELLGEVARQLPGLFVLAGLGLGGVLGSFAGCMVWRWRRGLGLRQPPSHCPACQRILSWHDLIPALSWVWQRGRCRTCRAPLGLSVLVWDVGGLLAGALLGSGVHHVLATLP